jgi:hypothetical protein
VFISLYQRVVLNRESTPRVSAILKKQTQFVPVRMSVNHVSAKDYENMSRLRLRKTSPNKANSSNRREKRDTNKFSLFLKISHFYHQHFGWLKRLQYSESQSVYV